jgi:glycosyltransferase involved in cell wall biosynthesis
MSSAIGLAVTPVILTYNEEPNIRRTLDSLRWAERVVVLDSGSTDATESIVRLFPNADWRVRPFDCHREQWEYGIRHTEISSPFVLALDADMAVPAAVVEEMRSVFLRGSFTGGITPFRFHVLGHALAGSIYPAQLRVFRHDQVEVSQSGHTQEFSIKGEVYRFRSPLIHDDRKSLERWVASQLAYSVLEERRIISGNGRRWRDRLRKWGLMPPIAGALAYLRAGGPWKGAAAARYAYERAAFECLLAIRLMSARLEKDRTSSDR